MTAPIWNGKGDAEGLVCFTKNSGEIVGRPYVRQRIAAGLSRHARFHSLEARRAVIAATVDDDGWLSQRNGQTVGSLLRDATKLLS